MLNEFPVYDPEGNLVTTIRFGRNDQWEWVDVGKFINEGLIALGEGKQAVLREAAASLDWKTFDELGSDSFPWYCRKCERVYRREEWQCWMDIDDDGSGWLNGYQGHCPKGHQRIVAD